MSVLEIDILDRVSEPGAGRDADGSVRAWINGSDRRGVSSITEMSMHPAYQQILGMGTAALPFIFRDLAATGDHWFRALKFITGADPVPESDRGRTKKMAQAWLDWGRANGHAD